MVNRKDALRNWMAEHFEMINQFIGNYEKSNQIKDSSKTNELGPEFKIALADVSWQAFAAENSLWCSNRLKELIEINSLPDYDSIDLLQDKTSQWIRDTFGSDPINDDLKLDRSNRFLEEAVELVQAVGMKREDAHKLVDYVYNREKGETFQEVGGVLITLSALVTNLHHRLADCWNRELTRVNEKMELIRKKDKMKKEDSPLPGDFNYKN